MSSTRMEAAQVLRSLVDALPKHAQNEHWRNINNLVAAGDPPDIPGYVASCASGPIGSHLAKLIAATSSPHIIVLMIDVITAVQYHLEFMADFSIVDEAVEELAQAIVGG